MTQPIHLRQLLSDRREALRQNPTNGRGTAKLIVRLRDGVACEIEEGPWQLIADEPQGAGGEARGPKPGVLMRAAIGSCLAMGYYEWGALLGVPIDAVEVQLESDFDAAAMFGLDPTRPAGWSALRYSVTIDSPAPEARVLELCDHVDRLSPMLDNLRRAVSVSRMLHVKEGKLERDGHEGSGALALSGQDDGWGEAPEVARGAARP